MAQTNNFAYKRLKEKLTRANVYLSFPVVLDGLRACGFADEPCHGCTLHQRAGPEAQDQPPASLVLGINWIKSGIKERKEKRQKDENYSVSIQVFSSD